MTEAGYYDYAPTVALSRPVACIGHPACAYREVVYDLAALTGLPLNDFDHRMDPRDLQPFLELLRPVAETAHHVIDMEGQGVHEVVLSLQKLLPTLGAPRESTD